MYDPGVFRFVPVILARVTRLNLYVNYLFGGFSFQGRLPSPEPYVRERVTKF